MRGMIQAERQAEGGANGRFGADPVRRAGAVRQPSLTALMSLTDWRCFVPETLGLLLAIMFLQGMLDASPPTASGLPHAFWIPVLLMAVQYGIMGGLFAAGSASLLFLATEVPARSAVQDFYEYAALAAAQPCAWFAAALVLGGLRALHIHHQARLEDQIEELKAAAEEFAEQLTGAARERMLIEERIAADTATVTVLLDAFAKLDLSSSQALLASVAGVFRHGAGADSFSVHLRDGDRFSPRFGFEDGAPMLPATLALLPEWPGVPSEAAARTGAADLPIRVPIRVSDAAEPIGFVVCTRIAPALSPAIVARRLNEVCRVLAKLVVACPEAASGTAGA